MSLQSPLPTLQALATSLSDLRKTLHPLLQRPLEETIAKLEKGSSTPQGKDGASSSSSSTAPSLEGRLDSAKLQVSIAYVLLDLVWMHLKLTGQDPSTHEVHAELSRVRSYFGKIKAAETNGAGATSESHNQHPPLPDQASRMKVDRAAAGRFVKGALAGTNAEKGKHTKFEVSDGSDDEGAKNAQASPAPAVAKKDKGRVIKDPFEGYADSQDPTSTSSTSDEGGAKKKKKRKASQQAGTDSSIAAASPEAATSATKKAKKKKSGKSGK